ncbi:MAG: hypothetical protein ABFD70_00085 [Syntrophaceae bacterium]|nr:hypothetical protein [Deltaproteobacteria bacterium]
MKKLRKYSIVVFILLFALPAGYTLWDMEQARNMASDARAHAVKGKQLDEYLSAFSTKDYRIIKNDKQCILVPKRGMGRYQCVVYLDGQVIAGSKAGFFD